MTSMAELSIRCTILGTELVNYIGMTVTLKARVQYCFNEELVTKEIT